MRNLLTDVEGVMVGNAGDLVLGSGVTVVIFAEPTIASVDVRGGAPGTQETDLLDPARTVEHVDAIGLSGGSAFGLEASAGVSAWLAEQGRGFAVGAVRVPIVSGAILFDLANGGDKAWGRFPPYRELGFAAAAAAGPAFDLGTSGAGTGATTATVKGGLGSASIRVGPVTVGALVAVNSLGSAMIGDGPHFFAGGLERNGEFGGHGLPPAPFPLPLQTKFGARRNTTIAVVVTNAALTKAQAKHLAVMAQDGLAVAIRPIHTPFDGDTVFAAATGAIELDNPPLDLIAIGTAAADCLARAVARAVFEATALPYPGSQPSWNDLHGED